MSNFVFEQLKALRLEQVLKLHQITQHSIKTIRGKKYAPIDTQPTQFQVDKAAFLTYRGQSSEVWSQEPVAGNSWSPAATSDLLNHMGQLVPPAGASHACVNSARNTGHGQSRPGQDQHHCPCPGLCWGLKSSSDVCIFSEMASSICCKRQNLQTHYFCDCFTPPFS